MTNNNFYIQYHNADKLECFPTSEVDFNSLVSDISLDDTIKRESWIFTTKKTVLKSIGGICFLIVGKTENRVKNYYLWCYFKIEKCISEDGYPIDVSGTGQDLKHPILLNNLPDFEDFKKFCGNFGIGFQNIDKHLFSKTLNYYRNELKKDNSQKGDKEKLKLLLQELDNKMLLIDPEKKVQEIEKTLRKDRQIVDLLKKLVDYKCQFPSCNSNIPTKEGINYVEVAHIKPVFKGGKSIIGNLIVLCPNHHKEFDLGKLEFFEQNKDMISGILNEKNFKIDLSENYSYNIL